jgi:hypothetical protein
MTGEPRDDAADGWWPPRTREPAAPLALSSVCQFIVPSVDEMPLADISLGLDTHL